MPPGVDGLRKRLGELQAFELQLAEYQQLYGDDNKLAIGKGPVVTFDAVEVRLTGVTQVASVLSALLRSVEIQEALLSAHGCDKCDRTGSYGVGGLIVRYGLDLRLPALLALVSADCPRRAEQGLGTDRCGAVYVA